MAFVLLAGFTETAKGDYESQSYLTPEEDGPFRAALAALLREGAPLSRDIREAMASLLVEDALFKNPRRITFGFRKKGKPRDHRRNSAIAQEVLDHVQRGQSVEDGVGAAMDRFEIDRSHVVRIWGRYRRIFAAIGGLLPTRRR